MKGINIYKSDFDHYLVTIDNDVYEMDSYANMPNGVNIYLGLKEELNVFTAQEPLAIEGLPLGVFRGIMTRLENYGGTNQ